MNEELQEPFNVSEELQKAIDIALGKIENRSFSERNPELGKMVNCKVCGTRHRVNERKCEQKFTYSVGDYELFREDENGELVPDYRTCMRPNERQTKRQVAGAAAFKGKRLKSHHSKVQLQFIERTRKVFLELGFDPDEKDKEVFEKNLQRARVLAAREIRRERELNDRRIRIEQDLSRRINKGLI